MPLSLTASAAGLATRRPSLLSSTLPMANGDYQKLSMSIGIFTDPVFIN